MHFYVLVARIRSACALAASLRLIVYFFVIFADKCILLINQLKFARFVKVAENETCAAKRLADTAIKEHLYDLYCIIEMQGWQSNWMTHTVYPFRVTHG